MNGHHTTAGSVSTGGLLLGIGTVVSDYLPWLQFAGPLLCGFAAVGLTVNTWVTDAQKRRHAESDHHNTQVYREAEHALRLQQIRESPRPE